MAQSQSLSAQASKRIDAVPAGTAGAYLLRPVADMSGLGDGTTGWATSAGASTSVWDKIDDPLVQPDQTAGFADNMQHSGGGPAVYVGRMGSLSLTAAESVTSVVLWFLARGNGGTVGTITGAILRSDGTALQTGAAENTVSATASWRSVTLSGAVSAGQLDKGLRFSLSSSNTLNANQVGAVYVVVNTAGASGGVYDGGRHVYSDTNAPISLMQTAVVPVDHPDAPDAGRAVQYAGDDGIFRGKSSAGLVSRMVTQAEYDRIFTPRPTIITAPVTITGSTAEQAIGSAVIPANLVVPGMSYRVTLGGTMTQSTTAAVTYTFRARVGAAGVAANVAAIAGVVSGANARTSQVFLLEGILTFRTNGASGTVIGAITPSGNAFGGSTSTQAGTTAAVAADTTTALTITVTLTLSATTASGVVQVASFEPLMP